MGEIDPVDRDAPEPRATGLGGIIDLSIVGEWPGGQTGYARSWRARSIDLTGFTLSGKPLHGPESPTSTEANAVDAADDIAARLRRLLQPPAKLLLVKDGPLTWPSAFFEYQRAGISTLMRSEHLLLGDEMGLGKTIQAIAALRVLVHLRRIERAIVVAPAGLVDQWMRALGLWAPELRCIAASGPAYDRGWRWASNSHVTVVAYETLRSDFASANVSWDLVVLDEAQKIKNPESQIASVCKALPRTRSWAITGTPLENRLSDLESILDFVLDRPSRIDSIQRAITLLSLTQVRRLKRDVLADLPPKIVTELPIELSKAQQAAYDRAERDGIVQLRELKEITISHVFGLIVRLKQICNFDPTSGESSKLDDLSERLVEIAESGNKALVFTQFADDVAGVKRIAARLAQFRPLAYTGQLDHRERESILRRFDGDEDRPVLVLSLKAGGAGLNLQRASYVFHFDRWWNPAVEAQAEDRVHRIGQPRSVNVYKYIVPHSIEQRIDDLIREKQELFQSVMDDSEQAMPPNLTKADLLSLIGY